MLLPRIIPCLLLKGRGLVKGVNFKNHRYLGDPINAVQLFNSMKVDELLFLDISATKENRIPPPSLVQTIADQCLMPFGVGGGIRTISDVRQLLSAGAEKVCLNTSALENPQIISDIANNFGSQSVVVSLDIRKNIFGKYEVFSRCGTKLISKDLTATLNLVQKQGAGEILINSIDRDGSMTGYDLNLLSFVKKMAHLPIIASGGAGTIHHLKEVLTKGGASAAAAGSMFVFRGPRRAVLINYPDENELKFIRGE